MKRGPWSRIRRLILCGAFLWNAPLGWAQDPAASFFAGAATADLTPQMGVLLDGAISKIGPARAVHDPLNARALVMRRTTDSAEITIALVINDLTMIESAVCDRAKEIVNQTIGIPTDRILIAATHSHATPRVMRIGTEPIDIEYHAIVAERIAEAVIAAHRNLEPARVGFGRFEKPEYVQCRRFLCEPGTVGPNPFGETGERVRSVAGLGGDVIEPAGPVDPEVSLVSIQHADGRPLALLANFGVHYCGGYVNGHVSADYFGVYSKALENALNIHKPGSPPFIGMMSNGASGDVSSIKLEGEHEPWEKMKIAGKTLARETLEVLPSIEHVRPTTLAMIERELELGVRKPAPERIDWAKNLLSDPEEQGPHRWSRIFAEETLHLEKFPERTRITLQAVRIGDIAITAIPCEVFAITGLDLKRKNPFPFSFTISLANGCGGYLPTPKQMEWGGYETWPARTKHLEADAEPRIRAGLLRMLSELRNED